MMVTLIKWLRKTGASLMFLGYFPLMPGTMGSAAMIAAIWYCNTRFPWFFKPDAPLPFWGAALALTGLSIWLSSDAESNFGKRDPGRIIIDECAGQFITFLFVPLSLRTLALGFALFRFFDVVKPFPVHNFEEIEGGTGITMDDIAAGIMSNITLHAILLIYYGLRTWLS